MTKRKKLVRIIWRSLRVLLLVTALLMIAVIAFLVYSEHQDYKPAPVISLTNDGPARKPSLREDFSVITWNIGYCGLGAEADFFYDGGQMVRSERDLFQKYLNGVYGFLADNDSVDFFFLQEVDKNSRRSYYTDQPSILADALPEHNRVYASFYNCPFVPMPPLRPMGQVEAGQMLFSRFETHGSARYAFPANFPWPYDIFMPDRCFIMSRIRLDSGKDLVLLNTHNSAFDHSGDLRASELWILRSFMLHEYARGNYVIAGGDFNQSYPGSSKKLYYSGYPKHTDHPEIPADFLPEGWQYVCDPHYPTNRDLNAPWVKGQTFTSGIDFFILSPNLIPLFVSVIDLGFAYSDHQPVFLRFGLRDLMQDTTLQHNM